MAYLPKQGANQWQNLLKHHKDTLVRRESDVIDVDKFIKKMNSKLTSVERVHSWTDKQKLDEARRIVCDYFHELQKKAGKDSAKNKSDVRRAVSKAFAGAKNSSMALSAITRINPDALVKAKKVKRVSPKLPLPADIGVVKKKREKVSPKLPFPADVVVAKRKSDPGTGSRGSSSGRRVSKEAVDKTRRKSDPGTVTRRSSKRASSDEQKKEKEKERAKSKKKKTNNTPLAVARLLENLRPDHLAGKVDTKEGRRRAVAPRVQYDPATGKKRVSLSDINYSPKKSMEAREKTARSRAKNRGQETDKENQCNVIEFMKNMADPSKNKDEAYANTKGLLVAHGMGSGKTLTSLWVAKEYITAGRVKYVNILAPNVATGEFIDSFERAGITPKLARKIRVLTHTSFVLDKKERLFKDSLVIVDEVHMFTGEKYSFLEKLNVQYLLLLSGTPAPNSPDEIVPLINLLCKKRGKHWRPQKWDKSGTTKKDKIDFLRNKVSMYNIGPSYNYLKDRGKIFESENHFPGYRVSTESVPMSPEQNAEYLKLLRRIKREPRAESLLHPFFARERVIINTHARRESGKVTPKIRRVAKDVVKEIVKTRTTSDGKSDPKRLKRGRLLLYAFNIDVVQDLEAEIRRLCLKEKGNISPSIEVYNGKTEDDDRLDMKAKFNSGKLDLLIISKAGSVGLDLQCTSKVFMYDLCWNIPQMNQIIGRAIRYKSHQKPCDHDRVDVYVYTSAFVTEPPKGVEVFDKQVLIDAVKKWERVADMIENVMQPASIDDAQSCRKR